MVISTNILMTKMARQEGIRGVKELDPWTPF